MDRQARWELIHRIRLFKNYRSRHKQCIHPVCHAHSRRVDDPKARLQFNGSFRQLDTGLRVPVQDDVNKEGIYGFRSSEYGEGVVRGGR